MLITRDWAGGIHSRIIEPYQNSILKIFASQCTAVKASRITPEIGHRWIAHFYHHNFLCFNDNTSLSSILKATLNLSTNSKCWSPLNSRKHSCRPQLEARYGSSLWSPPGQNTFLKFLKIFYSCKLWKSKVPVVRGDGPEALDARRVVPEMRVLSESSNQRSVLRSRDHVSTNHRPAHLG